MCSLMLISRKNGNGNNIPATGIQVIPKHARRYTNWKSVKAAIHLKGTDSTNEACAPSNILADVKRIHQYVSEAIGGRKAQLLIISTFQSAWSVGCEDLS